MDLLDLMIKVGVKDETDSGLETARSKVVGALGSAAGVATAAVSAAVAGVGTLGTAALNAYSSYEQLAGGVAKLYGNANMSVEEYAATQGKAVDEVIDAWNRNQSAQQTVMANAAKAYQSAGMSANDYMETATSFSASLISSLGGDTQKAAEITDVAMRAMSDNINTFGSNAEDVRNAVMGISRQNYTMLDNLKLGYAGTKEGMQQLIDEANRWGAANGEASNLSIDSFADCITAIQQVQEEQGIAGTTAREAATTIEGSVSMAKAAWENWVAGLGNTDADMGQLTQSLLGSIDAVVTNVAPRIAVIGSSIVDSLPQVANAVVQAIPELAGPIVSAAGSLIGDIAQNIVPALQGAMQTMHDAIYQGQAQLLLNFGIDVSPVVNAVERIKNAAEQAFGSIDVSGLMSGLEALGGAAESIGQAFAGLNLAPLFDGIAAGINAVIAALEPCGERLQETFSDPAVQQALQLLVDLLGLVANAIGVVLGAAITYAVELFSELLTTISQVIVTIADFVTQAVQFFTGDLPAAFQGFQQAADSAMSEAGAAISGLLSAIGSFVASAIGAIGSFVSSAISAAAQAGSGFLSGIQSFFGQVPGAIAGFIASAVSVLVGLAGQAASAAASAGQSFLSAIQGGFDAAVSFVGSIPSRIVGAIGNVGSLLYEAGSSIISGFLDGLKSAWGSVTDFVGGIADWIASHKGPIEYDRRLLIPHGNAIMAGLGEGIESGFATDVIPLVEGAAGAISDAMDAAASSTVTARLDVVRTAHAGSGSDDAIREAAASILAELPGIIARYTPVAGDSELERLARRASAYAY